MRIDFAVRRRGGYISPYSLSMFYGAWRASLYFSAKTGQVPSVPMIRFRNVWRKVPGWAMIIFRPFNTYRATLRGERFY